MNQNNKSSEVKNSNLTLVLTVGNDDAHLYVHNGYYYTDNKEAIKAALLEDMVSFDPRDVTEASSRLVDICLAGGWDAMYEI